MYQVYLCQAVPKNDVCLGDFVRRYEIRVPPTKGMTICLMEVDRGYEVIDVWITPRGAVICHVEDNNWNTSPDGGGADCPESDWPTVLKHETEGWTRQDKFDELEPEWES